MQWVTIMLDPRPLFADQRGLSEVFPWIMPGIAGMAACLIVSQRGSERPGHILIVGSLSTYVVLYLAYRGLNPDWLWRYNLYHYFQWILPLFALYAVLLVFRLASPAGTRWRTAVSAAAALVILLPWRVEVASAGAAPQHANGGGITIPGGLPELGDSAIIEANGGNTAILMGDHRLMIGQHQFANLYDFQAYPRQSGLMITPLRRLPSGDARIILYWESPFTMQAHRDASRSVLCSAGRAGLLLRAMRAFRRRPTDWPMPTEPPAAATTANPTLSR